MFAFFLTMSSSIIHAVACQFDSFLWLNNVPLYASMTLFIHSSKCWLKVIWVVSVFRLLWITLLTFTSTFRDGQFYRVYIYLGGELLAHSVTLLTFLRNCPTLFQSSHTILCSHQKCMKVTSPPPCQYLLLSVFFVIAMPVGAKWYLTVLIWISLKTNDVEHLFLWVPSTCISLQKCLFKCPF